MNDPENSARTAGEQTEGKPKGEPQVSRRSFGKAIAGGIAALIVAGFWGLREWYHRQTAPVRVIARTNEIPVRGSKIFQYPTDVAPCILVRTAENDYAAYSRLCTHNSCAVFWHT